MTALRFAVIGSGTIVLREHLPALKSSGCDVSVFVGRTLDTATAAVQAWGGGEASNDWKAALTRPDVDAVLIATPNHLHAEVAIAAADAGKHVLVEKPMAASTSDAEAMLAAAATHGVVLMTAHNLRLLGPFRSAAATVANGDLGVLREIHLHFGHAGPQLWAPGASWFRDPARSGGGALLDLGIHVADLIRMIAHDEVTEVTAMTSPSSGVEETAAVAVRFAGGSVGTLRASWQLTPGPDFGLTVQGSEGRLTLGPQSPLTLQRPDGSSSEVEVAAGSTVVAEFLTAVGGGVPAISALDGWAALAIVEAAYRSAASGCREAVKQPPEL